MQGPVKRTPTDIVLRILVLNFASLFTTSMACAFAMLQLADHPELQDTLREEVKGCIESEGGVKKAALNKMYKLDRYILFLPYERAISDFLRLLASLKKLNDVQSAHVRSRALMFVQKLTYVIYSGNGEKNYETIHLFRWHTVSSLHIYIRFTDLIRFLVFPLE